MEKEINENNKNIGHVKNIKCLLTEPIKLTIDSMDMNSLTLLVGQNGSGKTLINKITYFGTLMVFIKVHNISSLLSTTISGFKPLMQYIFENTFSNPEELSGDIVVNFEYGTFKCRIEKGIITTYEIDIDPVVTQATSPKYLSTATRLFTSMESILLLYKLLPEGEIFKHCRFYDLMHCLSMREFALNKSVVDEKTVKTLKESYDTDITSLHYDEATCKFSYVDSNNSTRLMSSLGAGHQSIINMMVALLV